MNSNQLVKLLAILLLLVLILLPIIYLDKSEGQKTSSSIFNEIKCEVERAYFEGQKDAINGNIRIGMEINGKDTCYKWTKSCWDDTTIKVIYNPCCK